MPDIGQVAPERAEAIAMPKALEAAYIAKSGRKPKGGEKLVNVTFQLTEDEIVLLDSLAKTCKNENTRSKLLQYMVREALKLASTPYLIKWYENQIASAQCEIAHLKKWEEERGKTKQA